MNTSKQEAMEIRNLGDRPLSYVELLGLYNVVNERYNGNLPTVAYSEFSPNELAHRLVDYNFTLFSKEATAFHISKCEELASAIVGRIWEMGVCRA